MFEDDTTFHHTVLCMLGFFVVGVVAVVVLLLLSLFVGPAQLFSAAVHVLLRSVCYFMLFAYE